MKGEFSMWEKDIDINQVVEIRTRTNVYFGVGAVSYTHLTLPTIYSV